MSVLALVAQFRENRMGGGGLVLIALVLIPVIIGLVVYGIVQLVKGSEAGHGAPHPTAPYVAPPSTARLILDERFARGEIDGATYLASIDTLRSAGVNVGPPSASPAPPAPVAPVASAGTEPT